MFVLLIQDHNPMHDTSHARLEWSFFRAMKQRGKNFRRIWAMHYAHLRGWAPSSVFKLPEKHQQPQS